MKSCEEVLDLLPEVAPTLTGEALDVREHLALCADCAEAAEAHLLTLDALRSGASAAPALGPDFADRVVAALPAGGGGVRRGLLRQWAPRAAAAAALFAAGVLAGPALRPQPDPATAHQEPARITPPRAEQVPAAPVETIQPAGVPIAAADYEADPLQAYVSEASLVLEAVHDLDASDPRALDLLARHVRARALVETGDRLLVAFGRAGERLEPLEPLIRGTQLILRKVRRADADAGGHAAWTLRREVEATGILDAYRDLLTAQPVAGPTAEDPL